MMNTPTPEEMAEFVTGYDMIAPVILRDLFAGLIAAGQMADPNVRLEIHGAVDVIATDSYKLADALLKARRVKH